jgi:hypothetical protein
MVFFADQLKLETDFEVNIASLFQSDAFEDDHRIALITLLFNNNRDWKQN